MLFIELSQLKAKFQVSTIQVLKNPATGKIFASVAGQTLKVEQALDINKPIRFMYENEEELLDGCIINVKPVEEVFSL